MKLSQEFDLSEKVIVMTGAPGLLGLGYVGAFLRAGARVAAIDLSRDRLDRIGDLDEFADNRVMLLEGDITDEEAVESMAAEIIGRFDRVDVLVNNAAMDAKFEAGDEAERTGSVLDYPLDSWKRSLEVTLTGTFICSRAFGKTMLENGSGVIVNIGSTYGIVAPDPGLYDEAFGPGIFKPPCYPVAKAAVIHLTKYLATHWGSQGVRVNCLSPGGVENEHPDAFKAAYGRRVPLGRMARREEMVGAMLFLVSDASTYMNGANLVVDGGWTAW